jgi:nitroreductase
MALDDPTAERAFGDALSKRYGAEHRPDSIIWNDTIGQLLAHRSVRAYLPNPLPEGAVETLVAAAQSSASSSNLQLWSLIAVADPETRAKLAALAGGQQHIIDAPLILLWVADLARSHLIAERAGAPAEGFAFFESFLVAAVDAALAAQNAVVAAESLGLGTVYIGALRNRPEDVAKLVNLPPNAAVAFGLVVGWPDPDRPQAVKPRLPQTAVLHHERYDADIQKAAIESYDLTARAFQESQGQPAVGWIAQILQRGASAAALNGRERLAAALKTLGFGLR